MSMSMEMVQETEEVKVVVETNYFDEYTTRFDALRIMHNAVLCGDDGHFLQNADARRILNDACTYVRDTAEALIPYGATTPNKNSYGRRV